MTPISTVILTLVIYVLMGIGVAKSLSRCGIGFDTPGDRAIVSVFWPIAITCMSLFGNWDD